MDLLEKNFAKLSLDRHFVDLVYMPILTAIALLGNIPTFYIFRYRSPSSVFSFNVQYLSLIYMVAIIIKLQLSIMILVNAEDGIGHCNSFCFLVENKTQLYCILYILDKYFISLTLLAGLLFT